MAENTVLVPTRITAQNVDAYIRQGVATTDIQQGTPLVCGEVSTNVKQKFVFQVAPATTAVKNVWLAFEPVSVLTSDGRADFANIQQDPREFINKAGTTFGIFKPNPKVDMIQVTTPFFAENFDPDTITGATYVEISSTGKMESVTTPTNDFDFLQFKIVRKEPLIIANGAIGPEGVDAWVLECTNN